MHLPGAPPSNAQTVAIDASPSAIFFLAHPRADGASAKGSDQRSDFPPRGVWLSTQ
jgi:hypothetical protein